MNVLMYFARKRTRSATSTILVRLLYDPEFAKDPQIPLAARAGSCESGKFYFEYQLVIKETRHGASIAFRN